MAAKRRLIVSEDFNLGYGSTAVPTDSGGSRTGSKFGIHKLLGSAYISTSSFTNGNAGDRIAAALAELPSNGGIIDARELIGSQTISADLFSGITKPVLLLLGAGTYTVSASQSINTELISIEGQGPEVTEISCTGNVTCLNVTLSSFNAAKAGYLKGFKVTGNSGASAVGIRLAAITGVYIENVHVTGFTGGTGILFENIAVSGTARWTERSTLFHVWTSTNAYHFRFAVNGGTNSFFSTAIIGFRVNLTNAGEVAFDSQDNALIYGGFFQGTVNKDYVGNSTSVIYAEDTSSWSNVNLSIYAEDTGGSGGAATYAIRCDAGASFSANAGFTTMSGFTDSCSQKQQLLPAFNGTAETGVVESPQQVAAISGSNDIGAWLHPLQTGISLTGLGNNLHFDGSNWKTENNGSVNGGAAVLTNIGEGSLRFFNVASTGGSDQSISNSTLGTSNLRAILSPTTALTLYGTGATGQTLALALTSDSQARLVLNASGKCDWGPGGASATDTTLERSAASVLRITNMLALVGVTQANLGSPADGTLAYCSDCTIASPCAGGGSGALAKRLNGAWICN